MKIKRFLATLLLLVLLSSCSVSERIVFNDDMSGRYETVIDLTRIATLGSARRKARGEKSEKLVMDTTVVFNELLRTRKDSIAQLPLAQQEKLAALKNMSLDIHMNEDKGDMVFIIKKDFDKFQDLERVSYEMDTAFESARKNATVPDPTAATSKASSLLKLDKVIYTFTENTFRRTTPQSIEEFIANTAVSERTKLDLESFEGNDPTSENPNEMLKGIMHQMGSELAKSTMKLEYVFPRKVLSVAPEGAIIAQDGKTVTFEIDWKTLLEEGDKTLDNFEVVLEEE